MKKHLIACTDLAIYKVERATENAKDSAIDLVELNILDFL
jgi:hypothetical protein